MAETQTVQVLPVLPLKNTVLFPFLMLPLSVGRASSLAAVEAALASEEKEVALFVQRDSSVENPTQEDLHPVGVKATIRKMSRPSAESMEILVLGIERIALLKLDDSEPFLRARISPLPLPEDNATEVEALHGALVELAGRAVALAQPNSSHDLLRTFETNEDPLRLAFLLASMFSLDVNKAQALLEAPTRLEALRLTHSFLSHEVQVLELRNKIATEARSEMGKEQREYLLRQQMRAIQQELGETASDQAEATQMRERLEKADLPDDVRKEAERELARLEKIQPASPEYGVIRTYLEYVLELPWHVSTEDKLDIPHARQVLDEDHFDLKEVKERILEQLGVLQAQSRRQGADPVLRRPSGRRQDVARTVDRARAGPQVRTHEPGRLA